MTIFFAHHQGRNNFGENRSDKRYFSDFARQYFSSESGHSESFSGVTRMIGLNFVTGGILILQKQKSAKEPISHIQKVCINLWKETKVSTAFLFMKTKWTSNVVTE